MRAARMHRQPGFVFGRAALRYSQCLSLIDRRPHLAIQIFVVAATPSGSSANPFQEIAFKRQRRCVGIHQRDVSVSSRETIAIGLAAEKGETGEVLRGLESRYGSR